MASAWHWCQVRFSAAIPGGRSEAGQRGAHDILVDSICVRDFLPHGEASGRQSALHCYYNPLRRRCTPLTQQSA
jgi:hypothetical protein